MRNALLAAFTAIVVGTSTTGCEPRRSSDARPTVDRGPAPDPATDPLAARLHATVVARAGAMEEVDGMERGHLREGASDERTIMLYGGYCYVFFVQGADAAGEISLRLVDVNGDPVQVDRDRGTAATLGLAESLCPATPGEFRLEVRGERPADYALRTFRTQAI